jgi:hypothetical protein
MAPQDPLRCAVLAALLHGEDTCREATQFNAAPGRERTFRRLGLDEEVCAAARRIDVPTVPGEAALAELPTNAIDRELVRIPTRSQVIVTCR